MESGSIRWMAARRNAAPQPAEAGHSCAPASPRCPSGAVGEVVLPDAESCTTGGDFGWRSPASLRAHRLAARAIAVAALLLVGRPAFLHAAETRWFPGTDRILPVSLVNLKDDGVRSHWLLDNQETFLWDFSVGTDVAVWEHEGQRFHHILGGRFGVNTRFEFGSESFDLWAADVRGGVVWGMAWRGWQFETLAFHESSHLGDEILERGDRERIDASVNGLRLSASRKFGEHWRGYGGGTVVPWAEPDELRSFALHLGAELRDVFPARRGYLAAECEVWDWRSWDPDVVAQAGVFIGPREEERWMSTARVYVQVASGRVLLGQFWNETETTFAVGMAVHW